MKEPLSNLRATCPDHSPKPGKYTGKPITSFIGKFCKLGFPITQVPGVTLPKIEHMWVKALKVKGDEIIGEIDNDPYYDIGYRYKERLAFKVDEIEEVLD